MIYALISRFYDTYNQLKDVGLSTSLESVLTDVKMVLVNQERWLS